MFSEMTSACSEKQTSPTRKVCGGGVVLLSNKGSHSHSCNGILGGGNVYTDYYRAMLPSSWHCQIHVIIQYVFYHDDGGGRFPETLLSTYETIHFFTFHKKIILKIPRLLQITTYNYIVEVLDQCRCPQYFNSCVYSRNLGNFLLSPSL